MRTARFNFTLLFGFGLLTAASCTLAACSSLGDDTFGSDDSGADAKPKTDSGADTSVPKTDSGADTSTGPHDSSVPDTTVPQGDTGAPDTGTPDTSIPDGGQADSPVNGTDAGGSLIAKWSFEEGSGTTAADVSGHGKAATLMTGASFTTGGRLGGGLALDGNTGYADIPSALIDTTKPFTVACWVKLNVVNTWAVALSQDAVVGSLFGLKLRGDNSNQFDFDIETSDTTSPGFAVAQSKVTATVGAWTHLVGVYDGTSILLYVNGAADGKDTPPVPLAATGHFLIGRGLYNSATGSFVNGVIDEVEVHNAALSSTDVAALYAAGSVIPDSGAPDTGSDTGTDANTDSSTPDADTDTGAADAGTDSGTDAADASAD